MVVIVLVVLVAAWILVVSPERKKASKLSAQVSTAQAQLTTAEGQLAAARTAAVAVRDRVRRDREPRQSRAGRPGSAVADLPALARVHRRSASNSPRSGPPPARHPSSASASSSDQLRTRCRSRSSSTAASSTSNTSSPSSRFTTRTASGDLRVSGRLLTIQSVKLAPAGSSGSGSPSGELSGTITATAYTAAGQPGPERGAAHGSPGAAATPGGERRGSSSPTAPRSRG